MILTAYIAAAAALLGVIVGTTGTIVAARVQHKFTTRSERQKETRARLIAAAEKCRANIDEIAKLTVHEQSYHDGDDNSYVERQYSLRRLQDEITAEALFLPQQVRYRVGLARAALEDANDLVNDGVFYRSVGEITTNVANHMNEVLTAVVRDERTPKPSKIMRHVSVALDALEQQRMDFNAEAVHEYAEEERLWLERNPEAREVPDDESRLARLRRIVARAIAPD